MRFRIALPLVLIGLSTLSWSWIDTGHCVVARIAERELKPEVKKKVDALLTETGFGDYTTFVGSAPWADDTKSKETGNWHYINLHFRTDGKPTSNEPEKENVVWAIQKFSTVLKNPLANNGQKAEALRYLIHFVADVHQPLHGVARDTDEFPKGDRGGNDFKVGDSSLEPKPRNLHFLWDIGGGLYGKIQKPIGAESMKQIDAYADSFLKLYPADTKQVQVMDPNKWAEEDLALAKTVVYSLDENTSPSKAYLDKCKEASGKRIVLAGRRLARLLNDLLK